MIVNAQKIFTDLLASTEVRKVDYKRDQFRLDDENLKSKFVKDIVCIANAPGDDGHILLGVKSEKGKPSLFLATTLEGRIWRSIYNSDSKKLEL